MGNCLHPRRRNTNSWADVAGNKEVVRVVKTDGKILEYQAPTLVEDLLLNFNGYGIGVSENASRHLPPNYELKVGHIYYLLPSFVSAASAAAERSTKGGIHCPVGSKRVKVIITKQQLEELLSKKVAMEDVLCSLQMHRVRDAACTTIWRPRLETIPE